MMDKRDSPTIRFFCAEHDSSYFLSETWGPFGFVEAVGFLMKPIGNRF